jgi:hypothetical protein
MLFFYEPFARVSASVQMVISSATYPQNSCHLFDFIGPKFVVIRRF